MAKKSRSHRRSGQGPRPVVGSQVRRTTAAPRPSEAVETASRPASAADAPARREGAAAQRPPLPVGRATRTVPPPPARVDFAAEYRYVIADLKRLGILALAMFVLLVVLALAF